MHRTLFYPAIIVLLGQPVHCGIVSVKSTPDRPHRRNASRWRAAIPRAFSESDTVTRFLYSFLVRVVKVIPLKRESSHGESRETRYISRSRQSVGARKKGPPLQMGAAIALNVEINSYPPSPGVAAYE